MRIDDEYFICVIPDEYMVCTRPERNIVPVCYLMEGLFPSDLVSLLLIPATPKECSRILSF